jgi:hypothetical protein
MEGSGPDLFNVLCRHLFEWTEETTKDIHQDTWPPDREWNPGLLKTPRLRLSSLID